MSEISSSSPITRRAGRLGWKCALSSPLHQMVGGLYSCSSADQQRTRLSWSSNQWQGENLQSQIRAHTSVGGEGNLAKSYAPISQLGGWASTPLPGGVNNQSIRVGFCALAPPTKGRYNSRRLQLGLITVSANEPTEQQSPPTNGRYSSGQAWGTTTRGVSIILEDSTVPALSIVLSLSLAVKNQSWFVRQSWYDNGFSINPFVYVLHSQALPSFFRTGAFPPFFSPLSMLFLYFPSFPYLSIYQFIYFSNYLYTYLYSYLFIYQLLYPFLYLVIYPLN